MSFEELILSADKTFDSQGRVARRPVNVNPGLNVNCSIIFSCLKVFSTSNVWCSLRLLQNKNTTLAENDENLISDQSRISAHLERRLSRFKNLISTEGG